VGRRQWDYCCLGGSRHRIFAALWHQSLRPLHSIFAGPLPPPPPPSLPAVTTFFGGTRFACATDHRLTDPVEMMMKPSSCPSAFSTGLEMSVSGEGMGWGSCPAGWLAALLPVPAATESALPVITPPKRSRSLDLHYCNPWQHCNLLFLPHPSPHQTSCCRAAAPPLSLAWTPPGTAPAPSCSSSTLSR
jgi:hypothetical protein